MTGVTIFIEDQTHQLEDRLTVTVGVRVGQRPPATVWAKPLYGRQVDYLDTLVEAVTRAWHFGATPRDVAKAAEDVHRTARRHARAHERQGALRGI